MVITTSASRTASAADAAGAHPPSAACCTASGTRSNARTSWPALTTFGAIPPPMCPNPMNAIFMASSLTCRSLTQSRDYLAACVRLLVVGGGEFRQGESDQVGLLRDAPDQCNRLADREFAVCVREIGEFGRVEDIEIEVDVHGAANL